MDRLYKICVFSPEVHDRVSQDIISGIISRFPSNTVDITIVTAGVIHNEDNKFNLNCSLYKQVLFNENFDGVIIFSGFFCKYTPLEKLSDFFSFIPSDMPKISLSLKIDKFTSIISDNIKPIENLVTHLIKEHNKSKIMFIKGPNGHTEAEERFTGYKNALKINNIEIDHRYIFQGNYTPKDGAEAVKKLFSLELDLPDAIVCADDDTALGVYSELKRRNINIKSSNIAITGFDNMDYTKKMDPRLTTVEQSFYNQGQIAITTLLAIINGATVGDTSYVSKVIYRESCGCNSLSDPIYESITEDQNTFFIPGSLEEVNIEGFENQIGHIADKMNLFLLDSSYSFIPVIEDYIRRYKYKGYNLKILIDVVKQLGQRIIPKLNRQDLEKYYSQIDVIDNLVIESLNSDKTREFRSFGEQSSEIDSLLMSLASCLSFDELFLALEKNLYYLGIKSLKLTFNKTQNKELKLLENRTFDKDDSLNRARKSYCSLFLPLNTKDELGVCKFKILLNSFHIAEVVSFQISRAIYLIELFDDLNEKIRETEKSYQNLRTTKDLLLQNEQLANLGGLVAGFTHEISTPIGVGLTATSHINNKIKHLKEVFNNEKLRKSDIGSFIELVDSSTSIILTNLNRAISLLQGFKQISVDQASEIERDFNLGEYLKEIVLSLTPILKRGRHKVNVNFSESVYINSFPGAISQIITNLIQNSIIHGFEKKEDGLIDIQLIKSNNKLEIIYTDNGCGIEDNKIDVIFDSYYTTKRGKGGSGLGLSIIKELTEKKLNGTIKCFSKLEEGVTFIITLPTDCIIIF